MFLQHTAGIPFLDSESQFIPAVCELPSPLTAVCRCVVPPHRHTAAFPIPPDYNAATSLPATRIRKKTKKESKVIPSGKCHDNIKPFWVF
ncbi:hypothetical protein EG338_10250 [Kaistella haifensis]|nr:hypothetical protein EG338_10250 [Kaistella haifensis]